jgi:hypothetical protein
LAKTNSAPQISTAEDFIDKVATETHNKTPYYIILESGEKVELRNWLMGRLRERRSD